MPYRLRLMRGEQEVARTLCILEVNAWREVPVVTRNIARGSVLSLQDMTLQRVEVSPRAGGDGLTLEKAAGQEAIRHIPAGTVLGAGWIRPIPDVQQGTTILLHYHGAGFTLAVHAEALTAGLTGERVRVRTDQGKTVHAEVTGTNEAAIYEVQTPESRQP